MTERYRARLRLEPIMFDTYRVAADSANSLCYLPQSAEYSVHFNLKITSVVKNRGVYRTSALYNKIKC